MNTEISIVTHLSPVLLLSSLCITNMEEIARNYAILKDLDMAAVGQTTSVGFRVWCGVLFSLLISRVPRKSSLCLSGSMQGTNRLSNDYRLQSENWETYFLKVWCMEFPT